MVYVPKVRAILGHRLYRPSHFGVAWKDFWGLSPDSGDRAAHLEGVMTWLKRAQDATRDLGVSAGYSFARGWLPSYPEVTGYIIPTFFSYADTSGHPEYSDRAIAMADFLLTLQYKDGAFPGGLVTAPRKAVVFNTGQILQGLVSVYQRTRQVKYLQAAVKAGDWLAGCQDNDGAWRKFAYNNIAHPYYSRVAWALLQLHECTSDKSHLEAGTANIDWAVRGQELDGWFRDNAFEAVNQPLLHTIAYAIEGILESSVLAGNAAWREAAVKPAGTLLREFEKTGCLRGWYGVGWSGSANYRCLTGEAQMSICWQRIFALTGEERFRDGATAINRQLMALQDTRSRNPGVRFGVKGSHPIWGDYSPYTYPCFAAKFLADALLLEIAQSPVPSETQQR